MSCKRQGRKLCGVLSQGRNDGYKLVAKECHMWQMGINMPCPFKHIIYKTVFFKGVYITCSQDVPKIYRMSLEYL